MPVYGRSRLSARAGAERSLEAMFKRHHVSLLSYCRHMLGDRDEAEDALQQAFIRAHRALLGGTAPREPRPWLYAIARNCCLSAIAARKPTAPLEDRTPALEGLSEQVRRREDLRELLAGIGRLPEDQRSALLLAELEDLSHREIAGIVGCEVSKVKALIYQARSALIADRDARNTPCRDIREQLAVARGGELRRGPLRRHLNLCAGCRDFQLAVGAQRQSLAEVLPVLPSAGLTAAILGHAAAHTAGTASLGGVSGGTAVSVSGAGATTTTAAGAGASAGAGTGLGTILGGGLVTKLAVGGTILALATAGAVTAHNREAHARPHRPARLLADLGSIASANTAAQTISATDTAGSGSRGPSSPSSLALVDGTSPIGDAESGSPTELSSFGGANPLLTPSGPLTSSIAAPDLTPSGAAGQTTATTEQKENGEKRGSSTSPAARAKRRAALRRRRKMLSHRKALLRQERAARRHARRKALKRQKRVVEPATPKPATTPAPVHTRHRKAHPTKPAATVEQSTTTPATGGEAKEVKARVHHRPATTPETGATGTTTSTGTSTTATGTAKTGSSTGSGKTEGPSSDKTGTGKTEGPSTGKSGSGKEGSSSGKAGGEASGAGKGSTGEASGDGGDEPGEATTGANEPTSKSTTGGPGTKPHAKKDLIEEEQLPNL